MNEPEPDSFPFNPDFCGACDHCRARRYQQIVGDLPEKDDQAFMYRVYADLLCVEGLLEEEDEGGEQAESDIHFDTDISKESINDDDKETQV